MNTAPLAEKITKGVRRPTKYATHLVDSDDKTIADLPHPSGMDLEEGYANAELVLEAFNTTEECGFTPRELLELARDLIIHLGYCGWGDTWERECASELMKRAEKLK